MGVISFTGDAWISRVEDVSPREDALRIADAVGRLVQENQPGATVYVGYDTRPECAGIAREMSGAMAARGVRAVCSAAHCTTAALCEAARLDPRAYLAIMLTADDRPADYFGVRLRMGDGSSPAPADLDVLEELIAPSVPASRSEFEELDLMTRHLERISTQVDSSLVSAAGLTVVCDAMYGACSSHAARLLASCGAKVMALHDEPSTNFCGLHPEAAEPWIDECEASVVQNEASLGIAIDGSGSRLALIDERGNLVSPHLMLALLLENLVYGHGLKGRMVAPVFISTLVRRQAERLGLPLTITTPGYEWMREEMLAGDVLCAGDAIGGITIPSLGLERDALAAAALLVEAVARKGKPLSVVTSEMAKDLGAMAYGRKALRMGPGEIQVLRNMLPGMNPKEVAGRVPTAVSHPGGLMLRFDEGSWLLVRPSFSSGLVSVYAEAPTPALRDELLEAGAAMAESPLAASGA